MLLAWSITETIRYSFFVSSLSSASGGGLDGVPSFLIWLRYNTFFVLYPIGITSECVIIYKSIEPATEEFGALGNAGWVALAIYVPGKFATQCVNVALLRFTFC